MTPERAILPDGYHEHNMIYSQAEIILLRWLELCMENPNVPSGKNPAKRLKNFDGEIKDGLVFANVCQYYIGDHFKLTEILKTHIQTEEDLKYNVDKLRENMMEYGIQGITDVKDILMPSSREMVLFCLHLFQT